jgi:hypothetical protein
VQLRLLYAPLEVIEVLERLLDKEVNVRVLLLAVVIAVGQAVVEARYWLDVRVAHTFDTSTGTSFQFSPRRLAIGNSMGIAS